MPDQPIHLTDPQQERREVFLARFTEHFGERSLAVARDQLAQWYDDARPFWISLVALLQTENVQQR